ncbi:N-6 DNA methylase, partial [Treponema sp.]|uniref:N-6 DNA methylase n=1 Tax=Treponema sp. TaxID=166 RepID=UPI003F0FFC71
MITLETFKNVLEILGFTNENNIYTKHFETVDCDLKADFTKQKLIYPTEKGFEVNDGTTSNFAHPENFVVFECVARLLQKGYRPEHIELEPRWSLGHGGKSGKADICVKNKDNSPYLCIIECKTAGAEYKKELSNMKADGGQLFSYWQQSKATKWLVLYASDFDNEKQKINSDISTVNCSDDANIIELAKNDKTLKLYKDAPTAQELFEVWKETYEQKFFGDIIFDDETVAYDIGVLPLKKKRLVDFSRDNKIVNQFEEILRHNNVSDKENAFNRLIALFIAKLYDEKTKTLDSEVEFQYKTGTDTYQKMQDRLQKLHYKGMKEFMGEEVFYVADDYVKNVLEKELEENRKQLEAELNKTITKLKFYTNNDFTFKDVHNEKLFYQNGKILVEMVELFQKYRIIDSNELQLLGDMFEQLLNKGFKQNEGQFFTPIPITCFIWKCLPLESIIVDDLTNEVRYPKVIDYACGAGHFLTEGFREINEKIKELGLKAEKGWERDCIFGIEKDYRLARVSKISMFMHGADNGNIVFGDGLDNHREKIVIENGQFDILVANPPYSVSAFKNHLELKHNELKIFGIISKDGKEIETLFVERIAQLLKPNGIAAVILPSSILSNSSTSYIKAREEILKNFAVHAIVQFGSKTFGATGTNTVALFLKKNSEPPVISEIVKDNVTAIFENKELKITSDKNIFDSYCNKINVSEEEYLAFIKSVCNTEDYTQHKSHSYFGMYVKEFEESADFKKLKEDKLNKAFYDYAVQIEKEKIYYFALVYRQQTLVVTAPADNAEQEAFLGYSWSNRKGDEGIKIKSSTPQNSCGLLYNVYDEEQSIARYVKDTFLGIYRNGKYIENYSLKDMIDFSRTTFDKAIKTSVQNTAVQIESKYPMVKLGEIAEIQKGKSITSADIQKGNIKVVAGGIDYAYMHNIANRPANIITVSASGANAGFVNFWKEPIFASDCSTILAKDELTTKYLFNVLKAYQTLVFHLQKGAAQPHVYADDLKSFSIPLPPLDVQKEIVAECETVDSEYQNAQKEIE